MAEARTSTDHLVEGESPGDPISATTQFSIGAEVLATDGACGELRRVVVDPVARALTHLVVEPKHGRGGGRLVPVDLVETAGEVIQLSCTEAHFEELEHAEETRFLPAGSGQWGYDSSQVITWPYYGLGMGGMGGMGPGGIGMGGLGMGGIGGLQMMGAGHASRVTVEDRVPIGEVQVHRGDDVHASDGTIGSVQGLVIDPRDHHVTHVLLKEGHLWGKKQVAIPIMSVAGMEDGVHLNMTKQEVQNLPAIELA